MSNHVLDSKTSSGNSLLQSGKVIFRITFGQSIRSKKTILMMALAFLPVLLAVFYRLLGRDLGLIRISSREMNIDPKEALNIIMPFFLQLLSILCALFYATGLVADEVDNRTIIYLFTRPIRKHWIILSKFAVYITEVFLILVPPMIFTFLVIAIGNEMDIYFSDSLSIFSKQLGVNVLALIVYGSIFTFFGVWGKHPVLFGLLFGFGWEKIMLVVPGIARNFSVIHYLMSLLPKSNVGEEFDQEFRIESASPVFSICILTLIAIAFIVLSIIVIRRKEYRVE